VDVVGLHGDKEVKGASPDGEVYSALIYRALKLVPGADMLRGVENMGSSWRIKQELVRE
jgi:hypothetical protein